jgi:formiminotetrahydrofolate cyclodeaminase
MLLVETPFRDLLAALASSAPTPGGGSASAASGAMGAALLTMVAGMPKTRTGSDEDRGALAAAVGALRGVQQQLTGAVDADTAAYDAVVAAYKQPKATDAEQAARKAAIQRALRGATDVPLDVMRLSAQGLEHAAVVAAHGHRAAASDVGVAVALLAAGLQGARLNVQINLDGLSDAVYKAEVTSEAARLTDAAAKAADAANRSLASLDR